jgi:hypothetical protein
MGTPPDFQVGDRVQNEHNDASRSENMQIICTTPHAAAQVLIILLAAHLQPIRDFAVQPILSTTPPITFTMLVIVTAAQVTKIRALADTTIIG